MGKVVDVDACQQIIGSLQQCAEKIYNGYTTTLNASQTCWDNLEDGDTKAKEQCVKMAECLKEVQKGVVDVIAVVKSLQKIIKKAQDAGNGSDD